MGIWKAFWRDEHGAVVTAELVTLGTVGVLSGLVGLNVAAKSVNEELVDAANSFRSLDQSFCYQGFSSCGACVPGSSYRQEDVEDSLAELEAFEEKLKREEAERHGEHGHRHHDDERWRQEERRRDSDRGRADRDHEDERARPRFVPKKRRDERRDEPTRAERDEQVRVRIPLRHHA